MNEFEELLRQHKNVLERFVKYKVQVRCDAEDLIQETCLAAYMNFETLKSREAFKSWLISIANNKCKDYIIEKQKVCRFRWKNCPRRSLGLAAAG